MPTYRRKHFSKLSRFVIYGLDLTLHKIVGFRKILSLDFSEVPVSAQEDLGAISKEQRYCDADLFDHDKCWTKAVLFTNCCLAPTTRQQKTNHDLLGVCARVHIYLYFFSKYTSCSKRNLSFNQTVFRIVD